MHCGEEADLPLLSGEGGLEETVQEPLGETTRAVRTAARFHQVLRSLATRHSLDCSFHIQNPQSRLTGFHATSTILNCYCHG